MRAVVAVAAGLFLVLGGLVLGGRSASAGFSIPTEPDVPEPPCLADVSVQSFTATPSTVPLWKVTPIARASAGRYGARHSALSHKGIGPGRSLRSRLSREAPAAKVAKNGQHNDDDDYDPKPSRHRDPFVRTMRILRLEAGRHPLPSHARRVGGRSSACGRTGSSAAAGSRMSSAIRRARVTADRRA
jgi:hypothetical protein